MDNPSSTAILPADHRGDLSGYLQAHQDHPSGVRIEPTLAYECCLAADQKRCSRKVRT